MSGDTYEFNDPIDRLLRTIVERDTWSYPAQLRVQHEKLLGKPSKPVIDDWDGDQPIYRPEPRRKLAVYIEPPEHFLWDSSQ